MREFPAWVGHDGLPLTWRMYLVGVMHLIRSRAREQLRSFDSAKMAAAMSKDQVDWVRLKKAISGED